MNKNQVALILAALVLTISTSVAAQTPEFLSVIRCNLHLVRVGETKVDVLDKCGEPRLKERLSGEDGPNLEQWVYKPGGDVTRIMTFRGVVLIRIERRP